MLWFLDGILTTDASWVALSQVRKRYESLGLVPQGYHMADLWLTKLPALPVEPQPAERDE